MIDWATLASKRQKKRSDYAVYRTSEGGDKPKYYALDMFPYPSGAGLHVGHPKGYIATDVVSRQKKLAGYNVLHPMGFDSFGLPTENYAMKNKIHPSVATDQNISVFIDQLKKIGFNYDRDRMVSTADPEFYKRTQWMFIQLYEHRYDSEAEKARPISELKQLLGMRDGKIERMKDIRSEGRGRGESKKRYDKVLILDGFGGDGESNWIPWLKKELEGQGYEVQNPDLPASKKDHCDFQENLAFVIDKFSSWIVDDTVIVAHSAGASLALMVVQKLKKRCKIIFVAPTYYQMDGTFAIKNAPRFTEYEELLKPYRDAFKPDYTLLQSYIVSMDIILSDDDPYIPYEEAQDYFSTHFPQAHIQTIHKGHCNYEAGCLELPEILDCLKPIKYLIFDYDGVLADTFPDAGKIQVLLGNAQSEEEGKEKSIQYSSNKPDHTKDHTLTDAEMLAKKTFIKGWSDHQINLGFSLFDAFVDEIQKLQDTRIAIVTSNSVDIVHHKKDAFAFTPTHILGIEDHHSKEEKIEQICRDRGCDVSEVYYFTDTKADVYELQDMITPGKIIGCGRGFCGYDALCEMLPKHCVMRDFGEINRILAGENERMKEPTQFCGASGENEIQKAMIPVWTLHKSHYLRDEAKIAKLLAEHSHSDDGYVDVTCAYIRGADGRIVLQHLVKDNFFVLPGGKVDKGETVEQAFVRECQEEVGIAPTHYNLFGVCKIMHKGAPRRLWYYDVTGYDGEVTNLEPQKHDLQYARIESSDNRRGMQVVLEQTIVSDADELSNTFRDIILCEKDFRDPQYKIEEWIDAPVVIESQDGEYITLWMDMATKQYVVRGQQEATNGKQGVVKQEQVFIRDEEGVVEYILQDGFITESYRREGGKKALLDKETKLQNSTCSIVIHPDGNKVLLAFRKKTNWILFPGGGIDGNETPAQTARREIIEETGYTDMLSVESFLYPIKKHHYHPSKGYNVTGTDQVCIITLGSLQQQEVSVEEQSKHDIRWIETEKVYDTITSPLHRLFWYRWLHRDNPDLAQVDRDFLAQSGEQIEYKSSPTLLGQGGRGQDSPEVAAYHSRCRKQSLSDKENFHTLTDEEKIDRYIDTEKRLAFISHAPINWCPSCMTALANEDLDGNVCERCGTTIERRKMRQWMIRITDYAQRLLDGLDLLPERQDNIKAMQRHWIGRSEGTTFTFQVAKHSLSFDVYTTRIDTVYGVTFVSLAPEHALVEQITTDAQRDAVMAYVEESKNKTDIQRQEAKEKTGVRTGSYAINPFTNEQIPIRVADYVLMDYGTGAVMAVPAHDERDWEFAKKFGLEVQQVVGPIVGTPHDDSYAKDSVYGLIYNNDKTKVLVVGKGMDILAVKYNMSGGTIEEGETLESALRREIQEETGLSQFEIEGKPVFLQAHYFVDKKEGREKFWRCNNSHVFTCIAESEILGQLQLTEDEKDGAIPPQWISVDAFETYLEKLGDDSGNKVAYQMLTDPKAMTEKGVLVNSGPFTGMTSEEAIPAMQARLDEKGIGKKKINYRIQDRVFSRQRYRGEPIPMLYVPKRKVHELRFRDAKRRDALGVTKTIETRAGNPDEKGRFFGNIAVGDIIAAKFVETGEYKHFLVTKTYCWKTISDLRDAGEETMKRIYSTGKAPTSYEQLVADFEATSPDYAERLRQYGLYGFAIEPYDIATDITTDNYQIRPMSSDDLPLTLPDVAHYEPTGTEEGPLAKISEWIDQVLPDGTPARRESNTMPGWAGSSRYRIRYMDPRNAAAVVSPEVEAYRGQVDLYVGGMEHACRHLIYARFRHKFLKDIGVVTTEEPFKRLKGVGLVLAEDGRKMSKRRGNVINPDDVIAEFGTDAFRSYEMFMGPFESEVARSTAGVKGVKRFLDKVVKISEKVEDAQGHSLTDKSQYKKTLSLLHKTIKKVGEDIDNFGFNTAVSQLMIYINHLDEIVDLPVDQGGFAGSCPKELFEPYVLLIAPFAPHLAEELWENFGHSEMIYQSGQWPAYDPALLVDEEITMAVQVNGKVRGTITVAPTASQDEVMALIHADAKLASYLTGEIKKIIYVPGKICNVVV